MCEQQFFICRHCGNLVGMIHASGMKMVCCGDEMEMLQANTVDASLEKHVPVVTIEGNLVKVAVGSVPHPMVEEHYIMWVYLQTEQGGQRKCLSPGDKPEQVFALTEGDKVIAAYEYCNLHGLWKKEV
jgi:superoxide reductase